MDEQGMLRQAKDAIQQGDKPKARALLREVIQANPASEVSWMWLSALVEEPALEQECLERVLAINPSNAIAQQALEQLRGQNASAQPDTALRSAIRADLPSADEPAEQPDNKASLPSVPELYGAGLVLPMLSPTFYWHAGRRRASIALYFFLLFALVLTLVQALGVSHSFGGFLRDAEESLDSGAFPQISLQGGRAVVGGADPFVREFAGPSILIVDTTGRYTAVDISSGYYQSGVLLTQTRLYLWNGTQLQDLRLSQLQTALGDPFVLDVALIRRVLNGVQLVAFVLLLLNNTVGRLISLLLWSLIVRAVANRFWAGVSFGAVFVIGVYALVPATYGVQILRRLGITFCGLPMILLLVIWAVGLVSALAETGKGILKGGRSLRPWRALIGAPMLLILVLDSIFLWRGGGVIVAGVTLLTLAGLAVVGLWPILGREGSGSAPG